LKGGGVKGGQRGKKLEKGEWEGAEGLGHGDFDEKKKSIWFQLGIKGITPLPGKQRRGRKRKVPAIETAWWGKRASPLVRRGTGGGKELES